MIRDGLTTDRKLITKHQRKVSKNEYKVNLFSSLVNVYENYQITQMQTVVRYLTDPYAILLLLHPVGVQLSDEEMETATETPTVTCQEYYEAAVNHSIGDILPRLTMLERRYCNSFADRDEPIYEATDVLRYIARDQHLLWQEVRDTWNLQPDPVAISFAIASPRAKVEPVTPVIGIPYNYIRKSDEHELIRFPCAVEGLSGELVQIHKDGELLTSFPEIEIPEIMEDAMSFVVEGQITPAGLKIWDILCWNDIWIHRRPLSERLNFLWRLHEYNNERIIVHNFEEMWMAQAEFDTPIARNLNAPYDPTINRAQIVIHSQTLRLSIGSRKGGGRKTYLNTSDNKSVFEYPEYLEKDELGNIVEVDLDGNILRLLPVDLGIDSWVDVKNKMNYEKEYGDYSFFKLPKAKWAK